MTDTTRITVSADLAHSSDIRAAVEDFAKQVGFSSRSSAQLVLVADELFMNAVNYGSAADDDVTLELSLVAPDTARLAVTDRGASGISPESLREKIDQHTESHSPKSTSGRGLAIIASQWMNDLTISKGTDGSMTVACTKTIS